jgi:hypothetical protein
VGSSRHSSSEGRELVEASRYARGRSLEGVSPFTGCHDNHTDHLHHPATRNPIIRCRRPRPNGSGKINPSPRCWGLMSDLRAGCGVRREAPGPSGVFHSIHEGNIIGGGRGRTVLGHAGGDYLLWLRAASQDQSGRQACPAYAVTTAVVQVGWGHTAARRHPSTRSRSALLHRPRRDGNSERVACHESWRRIRSPRHRHNP